MRCTPVAVFKAVVRNGRIVLDLPTTLPDGSELELVPLEDLDEEDRAQVEQALAESEADVEAGRVRPAEAVLADLRRDRGRP